MWHEIACRFEQTSKYVNYCDSVTLYQIRNSFDLTDVLFVENEFLKALFCDLWSEMEKVVNKSSKFCLRFSNRFYGLMIKMHVWPWHKRWENILMSCLRRSNANKLKLMHFIDGCRYSLSRNTSPVRRWTQFMSQNFSKR